MNMQLITIEEFVFINGSMWILANHINKLVSIVTYELKEDIEKVGKYYEFMNGLADTDEKNDNISSKNPCFKKIELKNISYVYPNQAKAALHNFNLSINKGQIISILGHNGSGKSTLAKILCGSLENYSGDIKIDDVNVKELEKNKFSILWGIGFQDFTRFSFNLSENIQIGYIEKKDDIAEIEKAIDKGELHDIINKMLDGLNTILGKEYDKRGQELSGGEWQRVILARAYMGEHPIIILDEPTAAIDPLEEYCLLESIREKIKNNTAFLISHRIGFAMLRCTGLKRHGIKVSIAVLKRLIEERKRLGLSQQEMAHLVYITQSNYSKVEKGLHRLSYEELKYLSNANVDIFYIFTGYRCIGKYVEYFRCWC